MDERKDRCKKFIYQKLLEGPKGYEELLKTYVMENYRQLCDPAELQRETKSFAAALFELDSEKRIAIHLKLSLTN